MAQLVKNPPVIQETQFDSWVGKIPWRRERQPTPVFWPGEFHELYSPWDVKESDRTEQLSLSLYFTIVVIIIIIIMLKSLPKVSEEFLVSKAVLCGAPSEKKDRLAPCTHEVHHWRQVGGRQVNPVHTGDHRVSALIQRGLHE